MSEKQAIYLLYAQLLNEGEQGISLKDVQQVYKMVQALDITLTPCEIQSKVLQMIDEAKQIECSFRDVYYREGYEKQIINSLKTK